MKVMDTLEKALEEFHGEKRPQAKEMDTDFEKQVLLMLRAIFDKVSSMDRYVRSRQSAHSGRTYVSEADREESRRKAYRRNVSCNQALQDIVRKITDE